jgi:hypothetical protein
MLRLLKELSMMRVDVDAALVDAARVDLVQLLMLVLYCGRDMSAE